MYRHAPSRLRGPVTRKRLWWSFPAPAGQHATRRPAAPVRLDLVARVRRELAEGRYDTPDKWDAALTHLFASLGRE